MRYFRYTRDRASATDRRRVGGTCRVFRDFDIWLLETASLAGTPAECRAGTARFTPRLEEAINIRAFPRYVSGDWIVTLVVKHFLGITEENIKLNRVNRVD